MTLCFKYFIFTSIIRITVGLSSPKYIYHELNENINTKSPLNFTMFIKNATGIILYAIDSNNKILIQIEDISVEKVFLVKYNAYKINEKLKTLCGCDKCSNIVMGFSLNLDKRELTVQCQEISHVLYLKNKEIEDQFARYPIPSDYNINKMKTYTWMGNIGNYKGFNDVMYHSIKSTLLGCLDKLYINNKWVNVTSNGTYFQVCCHKRLHKMKCDNDKSSNKSNTPELFNWEMVEKNRKICIFDYLINNSNGQSFVIDNNNNQSVAMVLEYKLRYDNKSNNYGLMEIQLQDESLVLFHISQDNEVVVSTRRNGSRSYQEKYRQKILPSVNNLLLFGFNHLNFFIKISSTYGMECYQDNLTAAPTVVNVGFFQHTNIIPKFEGVIGFNCSWPQCLPNKERPVKDSTLINLKRSIPSLYLIIAIASLFIFTCILIMMLVFKKKNCKAQLENESPIKVRLNNANGDTDTHCYHRQSLIDSVYMVVIDGQ